MRLITRKLAALAAASAFACVATSGSMAAEYKIRLGHSDKPGETSITHKTALHFAELVDKYTDGKAEVMIFPANQLGDQVDQVRSLQSGVQQMTQGSAANFSNFAPPLYYLTLPYMFTSLEQARATIDAMWDQNNEWLAKSGGIRVIISPDMGFRHLTANSPVRKLEDLKPLRIRLPNNPVFIATFKKFGAAPIPIGWSETFTALQQGVVNAQENNYQAVLNEHFDEVQKYATDIGWQYNADFFVFSEKLFQQYPKEIQVAIARAGRETTVWQRALFDAKNAEIIATLKSHGMEFLGQPEDFDEWVKRGRAVWSDFYELIGGGDKEAGKQVVEHVLAEAQRH